MKVVKDLFLSLNKTNMSLLALHDSYAFDTIDHYILVYRLHADLRLTDTVLQCFSFILSDLPDTVRHIMKSLICFISYGKSCVPQGSVSHPIIFSMYVKN